jgi:hypothetical protein
MRSGHPHKMIPVCTETRSVLRERTGVMSAEISAELVAVPSWARMCAALQYGYDPQVKFRVQVTLSRPKGDFGNVLREIQVTGLEQDEECPREWAKLKLILHGDLHRLTGNHDVGPVKAEMHANYRRGDRGRMWIPAN